MIAIVDYGMGNLRSVLNKLQRMDVEVVISSGIEDIEKAEKLILPGVGSFAAGMNNLEEYNLISILQRKVVEEKTPILGICLGMQMLTKKSEEGGVDGLGWIDADTKQFKFKGEHNGLKLPHMGWNSIDIRKDSPLLKGISTDSEFYFVHSYHVCCNNADDIAATTNYGYDFS